MSREGDDEPTGSPAVWTRTSPTEQRPSLFTTVRSWIDPFKLVADEDPMGSASFRVVPSCSPGQILGRRHRHGGRVAIDRR
jgi:hypothetical protein